MGLLSEILRVFGSLFSGKAEGAKQFTEAIGTGDRYTRWGYERNDIRDFVSAMEHFVAARDDNAPKADFLVKKYVGMCKAVEGAQEILIKRFEEIKQQSAREEAGLKEEQKRLESGIKESEARLKQMKEDGALIKAKDEENQLTQAKNRMKFIKKNLTSGEGKQKVMQAFNQLVTEGERMIREIDDCLVALDVNAEIEPETTQRIREAVDSRIQACRENLHAQSPE